MVVENEEACKYGDRRTSGWFAREPRPIQRRYRSPTVSGLPSRQHHLAGQVRVVVGLVGGEHAAHTHAGTQLDRLDLERSHFKHFRRRL